MKLMALAAIFLPAMLSCSSDTQTPLFGSLPEVYSKFKVENDALQEEAKNIKTEAEKAELIKKSGELKEKWTSKIEASAKALDGKTIEFAESDIKVTEPISLQYEKIFSDSKLNPQFKINGAAEAATDIPVDANYMSTRTVNICGYNAEGQEIYKINVGRIATEEKDGQKIIAAGTPVQFSTLYFPTKNVDEFKNVTTLKLEVSIL